MKPTKIGGRVNPANMWRSPTMFPSKKQGLNKDPLLGNQRKGFRNSAQKTLISDKPAEPGK